MGATNLMSLNTLHITAEVNHLYPITAPIGYVHHPTTSPVGYLLCPIMSTVGYMLCPIMSLVRCVQQLNMILIVVTGAVTKNTECCLCRPECCMECFLNLKNFSSCPVNTLGFLIPLTRKLRLREAK